MYFGFAMIFIVAILFCAAIFSVSATEGETADTVLLSPADIPGWDVVYSSLEAPDSARVGEVVVRLPGSDDRLRRAETAYDPGVYGVVVEDSLGSFAIAVGGEVDVLVDPAGDTIRVGDWLVPSGATGRIMRADSSYPLKPTVLGIALTDWTPGQKNRTVKVLLLPGERVTISKKEKQSP